MKRLSTFSWIAVILLVVPALVVPVRAETRIEKNLKLEPGGRFILDADGGAVVVRGSREAGVRVVVTSQRDDLEKLYDFKFEEGPGEVRVAARRVPGSLWKRGVSFGFEVRVPETTGIKLHTGGGAIDVSALRAGIELETSGGSLDISDVTGDVAAQTSGGSISVDGVKGAVRVETSGGSVHAEAVTGPLTARTSGGSISVSGVTGDADAETSGGPVLVKEAGGHVRAYTSGGSIEVSFVRRNGRGGDLDTSGGSVRVFLDASVNLNLDASTTGGSVSSDIPVLVQGKASRSSLEGKMGKGGELLRIRASGGSVRLFKI